MNENVSKGVSKLLNVNIKKLDGESITELTRDIVIKYIEKVTVYENEKIGCRG